MKDTLKEVMAIQEIEESEIEESEVRDDDSSISGGVSAMNIVETPFEASGGYVEFNKDEEGGDVEGI